MKSVKKLSMALAVIAVSTFVFGSAVFASDRRAVPAPQASKGGEAAGPVTAQTQAWLHIPGETPAEGIPVEITARPSDRRANVMVKGNENFLRKMKVKNERRARFSQVKLVIREHPSDKQDTVYTLTDATIGSIQGSSAQTSSISMQFDRMSKVAGYQQNPGIPAGAPAIVSTGINKGWVHFAETKGPNGVPVDVISYTTPEGTGEMRLTFEGSETLQTKLAGLLNDKKSVDMLILMLPDTGNMRYVEYKLAKASVSSLTNGNRNEAVFSSNEIECLTGANAR